MTIPHRAKQWWKEAVVYQIYPASFCDSNGDGTGDIPGITSKLDYVASLGVDVIWVSPMYQSPQVDMGYDISDYEAVHEPYGTLDDMQTLIRETHSRGMRVMMDLVINHTQKRSIYRRAVTSQQLALQFRRRHAWEWDEETEEYYLHVWAKEQPDLNWENPDTRNAIYASAMKFWLDRGVDGFRIDTVNMYSKPADLPDAPILDPKAPFQPAASLYCNGPRMHEYLSEMRQILDHYGAITVGELLETYDKASVLPYVSAQARQLDMVFQFDAVEVGWGRTHKYETTFKNYTLPEFKRAIGKIQDLMQGTDAWTAAFLENHDLSRSVSRLTDDRPEYRTAGAKLLALLQCCLSGTLYVYQGQEIGAVNAPKETYPLEYYEDVSSRLFIQMVQDRYGPDNKEEMEKAFTALQHLARDHSRIPLAWNGTASYGGFSEAAEKAGVDVREPWMKPHPLKSEINVASQLHDPNSALSFWRKMLQFRKQHHDLFVYGEYRCLDVDNPDIFTFVKETQNRQDTAFVVLNFTSQEQCWCPPTPKDIGVASRHLACVLTTRRSRSTKLRTASMPRHHRHQLLNRDGIAFVNLSHPDDIRRRDIQKGIRSHVMADVGQSRRKKPRHVVIPLEIMTPQADSNDFQLEGHPVDGQRPDAPETPYPPRLFQLNRLGILGVELNDRTLQIVHFIAAESEYINQPFHAIWVRMGFSDPTALHLSMATTLLLWNRKNNVPVLKVADNMEAVRYYSKALKDLATRLSDPFDRTSAGVVATIIGCLCHDVHIGDWGRWSAHIDGLYQVSKLRGGLDRLDNHIPAIASWWVYASIRRSGLDNNNINRLDLVGSAALDTTPRFPVPIAFPTANKSAKETLPALRFLISYMKLASPQLSLISEALCMMSSVAQKVNSNSHSPEFWKDGVSAIHLLGPVTHHLLSACRACQVGSEASEVLILGEMIRLTCLMLLSRLKGMFSLNTLDMATLWANFMTILSLPVMDKVTTHLNDLGLWALVTCALVQPGDGMEELLSHIDAAMRAKGITDMHGAIDLAKALIWIDAIEGQGEILLAGKMDSTECKRL
ncbi:hypothetical protein NM208_g143 [Fusarium decemcellulare]|uniref:Uncharacterized protein n=1 Tax=Fusarium decemcellulare TaxID=57161 RepID=A0ACC1T0K7_9HYPO|nr:hypothetical protein NM208_g143 [Fusarium decemcellulare]